MSNLTFAFVPQRGSLNPLNVVDVDNNSVPAFVDVDGDGDLDVFVGNRVGVVAFYRNNAGSFTQQTGNLNPLNAVDVGNLGGYSAPAFVDVDGDGDFDAVVGNQSGTLPYFRNDGGTFVQLTGTLNPFNSADVGFNSLPVFADIDADGDSDVVVGSRSGTLSYFRNDGGTFVQQPGTLNPVNAVAVSSYSAPAFNDVDGDGDLDVVVGSQSGTLSYFRNDGGTFVQQTGTLNPFEGINLGAFSAPAFADIDIDGDQDAFVGSRGFGDVILLQKNVPIYVERTGTANPFNGVSVISSPVPTFADIDSDGDLDAFVGEAEGRVLFYRNDNGIFNQVVGSNNPLNNIDVGFFSTPTFADIDSDGDLDLLSGKFRGTIDFYRNNNGQFVEQLGAANPFNGVDVGNYSNIAFSDTDGDGDEDAFLGLADGTIRYLRNENGSFVQRDGALNPLNGFDAGYFSFPSFADIDGDGDDDAMVGEVFGRIQFYRNDGGTFTQATGSSNPFVVTEGSFYAAPSFADIDGDGDLDTVVGKDITLEGSSRGRLLFFENVDGDAGVSGPRTVAASLLASTEDELLSGGQSPSAAALPDIAIPLAATAANADAQRDELAEVQAMMAVDEHAVI